MWLTCAQQRAGARVGIREPRGSPTHPSNPVPNSNSNGFLNRVSEVRVLPGALHGSAGLAFAKSTLVGLELKLHGRAS